MQVGFFGLVLFVRAKSSSSSAPFRRRFLAVEYENNGEFDVGCFYDDEVVLLL